MLWKSSVVEAVTPVTPKSARALCSAYMCSAHAGKFEITRKKKRVDSCGMLVQTTEIKFEPDVRLGGLAPARPIIEKIRASCVTMCQKLLIQEGTAR